MNPFGFIKAGMDIWVDPPRELLLEVDHDYEKRVKRNRGTPTDPLLRPIKSNPIKWIGVKNKYYYYGKECYSSFRIAIDLKRQEIDYTRSSLGLFGKGHRGSGEIGLAILTLPFTILLMPIILILSNRYRDLEHQHQICRHDLAVLKALKGQLDKETEELLERAMRNSWKHRQRMNRRVNLEEAKTLLSRCKLTQGLIPEENYKEFHWFENHDDREFQHSIANGKFYAARDEHYVEVLGSRFEGKDADELIRCFATVEVWSRGERQS